MKKVMAVYDYDPLYAERLSDFVNRKGDGIFEARAFTTKERLEEYAKDHTIDVLLTGEEEKNMEFQDISAGQHILLSEERAGGTGEVQEIYKYQSGDEIIREVMACYGEVAKEEQSCCGMGNHQRVIGVYSPIGRCGKTSFAFSYAQVLAKEEKVLFCCLDEYSGFTGLIRDRWKRDLSDLFYYYKQGRFSRLHLNSVLYYIGDLSWLPPLKFPEDYWQIPAEDMAGIFSEIRETGAFDTIVIDIGNFGRKVFPLLDICDVIYMPVKEDEISQAKIREFDEYVSISGVEGLEEKIRKIHVPLTIRNRKMDNYPQELMWGELGDFVRNLVKGPNLGWEEN